MSCPAGLADYYFLFPRTEINQLEHVYEGPVLLTTANGNEMEVSNMETREPNSISTTYLSRIEPAIEPVSLRYDFGYDMLHRELSTQKKLNHSLQHCPERLHPKPVRMRTPAAGWTELPIKPSKASDQELPTAIDAILTWYTAVVDPTSSRYCHLLEDDL
jgi:hypothetical protein